MKNILISGGTGGIGSHLVPMLLRKGYKVTILTRNRHLINQSEKVKYALWNPADYSYDASAFKQAEAIIHLAGANIASGKWTAKRKKELYDSRIKSSRTILKALSETDNHVSTIVSASGINYYRGNEPDHIYKEDDPPGNGFMSKLCIDWEKEIRRANDIGRRTVILRTAMVLDKTSGAYPKMSSSLKFRIATVIGNGKQKACWIHITDLCRAYIYAIENESVKRIYNAAAPEVVSNEQFITSIAHEKSGNRFLKISVPSFFLKMALGQLAEEAILSSITVSPQKLIDSGFQFEFGNIQSAVHELESK